MKKHLPLTLVLLALPACNPDQASVKQAESEKTIAQALTHLQRAASGARHTKRESDPRSIEQYRQDELAEAAKAAQSLASTGAPGDQLAARHIAAEAAASQGRFLARLASQSATQQAILGSRLASAASSYRLAQAGATARGNVEFTKTLGDLRKLEEQLTSQRAQLTAAIQQRQQAVDALTAEQGRNTASRKQKVTQQDELARKSFTAKGRLGYDLYMQSAQAGRDADRLNAQADVAAARADVEQAQLRIDQANTKQLDEQIAQVREMIASLDNRSKQAATTSQEAAARAEAIARQFDELFKQYVTAQQEQVNKPYDAAVTSLQKAVEQMQGAPAVGGSASFNTLELASRRAQLGFTLQEAAIVAANYRDTLRSVATSLQAVAPDKVGRLNDVVKEAEDRAAKLAEAARAALTAAAEDLKNLGDDENAKALASQVAAGLNVLRNSAAPAVNQ